MERSISGANTTVNSPSNILGFGAMIIFWGMISEDRFLKSKNISLPKSIFCFYPKSPFNSLIQNVKESLSEEILSNLGGEEIPV